MAIALLNIGFAATVALLGAAIATKVFRGILTPMALAFPIGILAFICLCFLVLVSPLPFGLITVFMTGLSVGLLLLLWDLYAGEIRTRLLVVIGAGLGWLVTTAILYPVFDTFTYIKHVDSMRYLGMAGMLYEGTLVEGVDMRQLHARLISTGILHFPANLTNDLYLAVVHPLIALSIIAVIACIVLNAPARSTRWAIVWAVLAGVLLVTFNRFVMHAFYINSHLLVAFCMVTIAGYYWWLAQRGDADVPRVEWVIPLAVCAMIISRPEGIFLALTLAAPIALCAQIARWKRAVLLVSTGLFGALWYGFAIYVRLAKGGSIEGVIDLSNISFRTAQSAVLFIGFSLAIAASSLLLLSSTLIRLVAHWRIVIELAPLGILLAFITMNPDVFVRSMNSTLANISTHWGVAFYVLLGGTALVASLAKLPYAHLLRMPVSMFFPLLFLLAYLRDGAYRVGGGDSMNRMMIQIVPLMVLFIALAAANDRWGLPFMNTRKSKETPDRA